MANFILPVDNPFLLLSAKTFLLPLFLHYERLQIQVMENFYSAIWKLKNTRTVLLLPHADRLDSAVAFTLSKISREDFYYLAARELFDKGFGLHGWFLSNCGAYSVIRGNEEDLASKEQTVHLIAEGTRKLVMFPEGDVTGRDDVIMPLKQDGIMNMLAAQQRILNKGKQEPVYLLPVALYYKVSPASWPDIMQCVLELEQCLNLHPSSYELEQRIENILLTFVRHLEDYYLGRDGKMLPINKLSIEKRMLNIIEHVSRRSADHMGISLHNVESESDLVHTVLSTVYAGSAGSPETSAKCHCRFCLKLGQDKSREAKGYLFEMQRMQQLLILKSTVESQSFDMELVWRILDRLQEQLIGRRPYRAHRKVTVDAAQPLSLLQYQEQYLAAPEKAAQSIDQDVRAALLCMRQGLQSGLSFKNQPVAI